MVVFFIKSQRISPYRAQNCRRISQNLVKIFSESDVRAAYLIIRRLITRWFPRFVCVREDEKHSLRVAADRERATTRSETSCSPENRENVTRNRFRDEKSSVQLHGRTELFSPLKRINLRCISTRMVKGISHRSEICELHSISLLP